MSLQELILSSSSAATCLHDIRTGALLTSFKSSTSTNINDLSEYQSTTGKGKGKASSAADEKTSSIYRKTTDYIEGKDGVGGLVISVVPGGKGALNVWSFQREAPLHRLLTPVKVSCLAISKNGAYLAAGSNDGRILLWELSSGSLLATFDGHYRAVTCLAWTDDDYALISGGDDSACHVWSLPTMLASVNNPLLPVSPHVSLSDHTLPITDIAVGFGRFPRIRVLTSSLDSSCKIWDLSLPSLPLLSTFQFPSSSQITQVQFDPLERSFFAVAWNSAKSVSRLHKVDLFRRLREGEEALEDLGAQPEGGRGRYEALGGGGRGDVERVDGGEGSIVDVPGKTFTLPARDQQITSLHLSKLSSNILVGTSKGQIHVLSLPSLQIIRTLVPAITNATSSLTYPITFLSTVLRPSDLISRTGNANTVAGGVGRAVESIQPRIVGQLSRNLVQFKEIDEKVINLRITGTRDVTSIIMPPQAPPKATAYANAGPKNDSGALHKVQAENTRLREQLARSMHMNERLWENLVDETLAKTRSGAAGPGQPNSQQGIEKGDVIML